MYKLISQSDYFNDDLLQVVCRNRKVDINQIKNPSENSTIHYSNLQRLGRAVEVVSAFRRKESRVGIIVDSDA